MSTRFRELIQPGTNFEFIGKRRLFLFISAIAVVASFAMLPINKAMRGSILNFSIDFKGGTEMVFGFDKPVDSGDIRKALADSGHKEVDVSSFTFTENKKVREGFLVRLPEFGAVTKDQGEKLADAFAKQFEARKVLKFTPSGDTFYVRAAQPIPQAEFAEFFKAQGLEMKPWTADQAKEFGSAQIGTDEYNYQVSVFGLDRKVQQALASQLGATVEIKQVDAVGAKAGEELQRDGIKSLLYAILLILLYVAFRFDFRYGPGTVAALLHDAIVVMGVFAVTWTEFSLTTLAAILTVIGYSMNDTIVVFDRIRENESRLKDKKFDRVINISINETLSRTILTSVTTFVTTLAMNVLGTGLVKNFAFAMNVGIIVGTYSSIFIAAPILLWLDQKYYSKRPVSGKLATSLGD